MLNLNMRVLMNKIRTEMFQFDIDFVLMKKYNPNSHNIMRDMSSGWPMFDRRYK